MPKHNYAAYAEMDLKRSASARQNQTQSRPNELMKRSTDLDTVKESKLTKKRQAKSNG